MCGLCLGLDSVCLIVPEELPVSTTSTHMLVSRKKRRVYLWFLLDILPERLLILISILLLSIIYLHDILSSESLYGIIFAVCTVPFWLLSLSVCFLLKSFSQWRQHTDMQDRTHLRAGKVHSGASFDTQPTLLATALWAVSCQNAEGTKKRPHCDFFGLYILYCDCRFLLGNLFEMIKDIL